MLSKIKSWFESEKCIYCGEPMNIAHEIYCPEKVLGYDPRIEEITSPTNEQLIQIIKARRK